VAGLSLTLNIRGLSARVHAHFQSVDAHSSRFTRWVHSSRGGVRKVRAGGLAFAGLGLAASTLLMSGLSGSADSAGFGAVGLCGLALFLVGLLMLFAVSWRQQGDT